MEVLRFSIHYGLHFLVPGLIAYIFFRKQFIKAWLLMIVTMFIDIDHLFATPIYDPNRCSINFHLLHTYWAVLLYIVLLFFKQTRIIAVGLLFHIVTDTLDCLWL